MKVKFKDKEYEREDLLTVTEVAQIFQKSRVTVYNWLGKINIEGNFSIGKFPNAFKNEINNIIYIPVKDVENIVEKLFKHRLE